MYTWFYVIVNCCCFLSYLKVRRERELNIHINNNSVKLTTDIIIVKLTLGEVWPEFCFEQVFKYTYTISWMFYYKNQAS